jgi:hypothetical protein
MAQHQFSVDQHSKDDICDTSIQRLEKVVELGRQAQAALDSIRQIGYFEGPAPLTITTETTDLYFNGKRIEGHSVRFAVLQKRLQFSRADLPPLNNLKLEFKKSEQASYGGHDCVEVPLWCEGTVARQVDHIGKLVFVEGSEHLGDIRINKHHLSFINNHTKETVQVFSKIGTAKSKDAARVFATRLADLIVDIGDLENGDPEMHEYAQMAARTLDLQEAAPAWFIEDGVVERMWREIHEYIAVLRVMEA